MHKHHNRGKHHISPILALLVLERLYHHLLTCILTLLTDCCLRRIMTTSQMEEKAYRSLNQSALKQITKALEDDPSIDLEPVVNLLHSTYAKYRQAVPERVARQQEIREHLVPFYR